MDEILVLQQQLAAVQQSSTAQRLSDRNVVELVMKLQSLNLVDLIFTRTGKQYLTHPQLKLEITDEILAQGGRVSLIDLPDVLNVDLHHIERKLSQIVQPDNSVRLVRGEIITDYYLLSLTEEVDDVLSSSQDGADDIGAIATRYALPVDIIKEAFISHRDSMGATYDAASGKLRSAGFVARERAAVCGALRAVNIPTLFSEISKHHKFQPALVRTMAEELLSQGMLRGVISGKGSRATFVPDVFTSAASTVISAAFTSNGFVLLERFRKLFLPGAGNFAAENLQGGVVLSECVTGPVLIETLTTSASEAIENEEWLDVASSLPPDFPDADITAIVGRIKSALLCEESPGLSETEPAKVVRGRRKGVPVMKKRRADEKGFHVLGEKFFVSSTILQKCSDIVTQNAVTRAEERAKVMTERLTIVESSSATAKVDEAKSNSRDLQKKGKGKGRRRATGKDKGNSNSGNIGGDGAHMFAVVSPSPEESLDIVLADRALSAILESDYLESSADGEEMLEFIIAELFGSDGIRELYEAKASEAVATLKRERALAKQMVEKELLTGLEHVQLFYKAAATLPTEELVAISRAWIIDDTCVNTLCKILDVVVQNTGINHSGLRTASDLVLKREKIEVFRDLNGKLPPTIEAKIRSFVAIVSGKDDRSAEDFLALYDESTALLDLPERRALERKAEKTAFDSMRAQMSESLDNHTTLSANKALQKAAILVHAKSCGGSIISFPSDKISLLCQAIEQSARPSNVGTALRELRETLDSSDESDDVKPSLEWSSPFSERMKALREQAM